MTDRFPPLPDTGTLGKGGRFINYTLEVEKSNIYRYLQIVPQLRHLLKSFAKNLAFVVSYRSVFLPTIADQSEK